MIAFQFKTDPYSYAFCDDIVECMADRYHISIAEAIKILNGFWEGKDFESEDDIRYHWTTFETAKDLYQAYQQHLRDMEELERPKSEIHFEFQTDARARQFCEAILDEMITRYHVSIKEATKCINHLWSNQRFVGEDARYDNTATYWADTLHDQYYHDMSCLWLIGELDRSKAGLHFEFQTDERSRQFCEVIIDEMITRLHISIEEAAKRVNHLWAGQHFIGDDPRYYVTDPVYNSPIGYWTGHMEDRYRVEVFWPAERDKEATKFHGVWFPFWRRIGLDKQGVKTMDKPDEVQELKIVYDEACKLVEGLLILDGQERSWLKEEERQRLGKALLLFSTVIHFNPNHWPSLWLIGKVCQRLGEHEQAFNYFCLAHECNPNHPDILREAANAAIHVQKKELAVELASRAVEIEPDNPGLLTNLAVALMFAERPTEAKRAAERALSLNPNDKEIQHLLTHIDGAIAKENTEQGPV